MPEGRVVRAGEGEQWERRSRARGELGKSVRVGEAVPGGRR